MCKYNIAACGRRTLPHREEGERAPFSTDRIIRQKNKQTYSALLQPSRRGLRHFCLTTLHMRRNTIYTTERLDAQTEKARSEKAGAETNRHPQPSTLFSFRHAVQRKSILRSQGSSPGPLRDAAPTQRGASLDCRCGFPLWSFTPHGVSGSDCLPAGGPERLASQASWAQERAQAFFRSHRVCADAARWRTRLDDCRLCSGRSRKVWHCGPPPESRAGVVGQKKTAESRVSLPIPEGTVEAYEGLRRCVVQLDSAEHLEGLRVFVRCGLAAWAQIRPAVVPSRLPESHFPSGVQAPGLDSFGAELVRLVAGLILSTRQEGLWHA